MDNESRGLIAWFANNPVAANLLMGFLIIAGLFTAYNIRKESYPDMKTRAINVSVVYAGATPSEVEESVIKKIESALRGLDGVKKITAVAYEGLGTVRIQARNNADMQSLLDKVKARVDSVGGFPDSIERPRISEEVYKSEVLWLALYGNVPHETLKKTAELLQDKLSAEEGISQVNIEGAFRPEIAVHVSETALRNYGITFNDVVDAASRATIDLPAGSLRTESGVIRLKTGDRSYRAADFKHIPVIIDRDGAKVPLSAIAEIKDAYEESDEFLRIEGKSGVGLQVFRTGEQSTLEAAQRVKDFLKRTRPELPEGVQVKVVADMSIELKDRLKLMVKNIVMGAILVFIALALFLRVSIAFWVMLGIPVCFLGTFWLLPYFDDTFNMITSYGFLLVLGILVDDAIVVGESVNTEMSINGAGKESAIRGTRRVAVPVTYGVLTTVAAFLPLLWIPGASGKLYAGIAHVVIAALLFSLVESKLILPAHLARIRPEEEKKPGYWGRMQLRVNSSLNRFLDVVFRPCIRAAVRHRYTTLAVFVALIIITAGLIQGGQVRVVFFPDTESDVLVTEMTMHPGTPKAEFIKSAEIIEAAAKTANQKLKEKYGLDKEPIKTVLTFTMGVRRAGFFAELRPIKERKISGRIIMNSWRETVGVIPGVRKLKFETGFNETGSAIDFRFEGPDMEKLIAAAKDLKAALHYYDGVYDIRDSAGNDQPELKIVLKPEAETLGVSTREIARQIRFGFYGAEVKKIQRNRDEVKVMVRYPKNERKSLADLNNILIRTSDGRALPLLTVADLSVGRAPAEIYRANGMRVVNVRADVDKKTIAPGDVRWDVQHNVIPEILKQYPGVSYRMAGEAEEQAITMGSLRKNAVLALFLIFALMAVPLKSYWQPFIIATAIPFGVVGAVLGHLIFNLPLSLLSFLGIIALAGVVVNDSLVLVDEVNNCRANGMEMDEALEAAGVRRFRAVMLTSVTTFLGLAPMVFEKSEQAQFLIPMAVALAFGILFSTLITLLLIPVLNRIGWDFSGLMKKKTEKASNPGKDRRPVKAAEV